MKEQYMTQTATGGENGKWDLVQVKNLVKYLPGARRLAATGHSLGAGGG